MRTEESRTAYDLRSEFLDKVVRRLSIIVFISSPHDHTRCEIVDIRHNTDLESTLGRVALIDADLIDPERADFFRVSIT
jgi:hypothetical protein